MSAMIHRAVYSILVFGIFMVLFVSVAFSSEIQILGDSVAVDSASIEDSSATAGADSIQTDSTQAKAQLEGPIIYTADIVSVSREENKIYLEGDAKVAYQNITLEAAKIMIDQDDHILYAEGVSDTTDSLGNPIYTGTPVFSEKGVEPIEGVTLTYDFHTKRGKIGQGKTNMPPGYYKGDRIHKIGNKTLLVEDGYFTSCEYIDNPHFYFRSDKMRVEMHEQIVARPVYLYIADVPVFVIPFGVFPSKKGRHSGILIPSYGESAYGGRFLRNIGYYWAPNDYIDATFMTDFYDKLGFTYKANLDYVIRYALNGRVSGFYFPKDPNRPELKNRWAFEFTHSQTIDPTLRLAAKGKFQSDGDLAQDYASDYNRRTNQILTSNLTLSKKWPGTKNSLQFSLSRTENLQSGDISFTAPNLRFTRSQSSLYETITGNPVRGTKKWYQSINFSYNGKMLNKGSEKKNSETGEIVKDESRGVDHALSFNAPQKIFKYLNISPSVSYSEIWVDEITKANIDSSTNNLVYYQEKQFAVRRMFNGNIGLNTTLFGLFEPNIGSLKYIRHKIDPRITFTFAPDFSDPFYGYFTHVADTSGVEKKVDKFRTNPFGRSTSTNKTQRMTINLNNFFQAKLINGDEETKLDLFRLDFATGHNFLADSLNWDNLRSNFRATPIKGVNFTISSSHSFYKRGESGKGERNEFSLPRLLNLNANLGFSLDQNTFKVGEEKEKKEKEKAGEGEEGLRTESDELELDDDYLYTEERSDEFAAQRITIPWRVNLTMNYNYDKSDINNIREKFNVKAAANVTITKGWKINWTATYDVVENDLVYQSISIYRDLHCWEMSFNWQPSIDYYSFRINVKADILQDLKLTKHPSGSSRQVGY